MKRLLQLFSSCALMLAMLSTSVSAQTVFDSLNRMVGADGMLAFYSASGLWVDLIVYLFLFVYVARFSLQKQEGMKKVAPVVGIALAVSAAVFEANSGFRLGSIGPFALAFALLIFAFIVYKLITGLGIGDAQAAAFAFIAAFAFAGTVGAPVVELLREMAEENIALAFIDAILNLALAIAVVVIIIKLLTWLPSFFGGGGHFGNVFSQRHADENPEASHADSAAEQASESEEAAAAGEGARERADIRRAEDLENAELKELGDVKDFLNKVKGRHLEPEEAKNAAGASGVRLKNAIRLALKYHEQAMKLINDANHLNYARLKHIRKVMQREAGVSARARSDPRRQKIEAHLQTLANAAWQELKSGQEVVRELSEIKKREEEAIQHIDDFVEELSRGLPDQGKVQALINSALGAIDAAEKGVHWFEGFGRKVGAKISADNPLLEKNVATQRQRQVNANEIARHRREAGI